MLKSFQGPSPPPQPPDRGFPSFRDWLLKYGDRTLNYHNDWHGQMAQQFNSLLNGYGADIASAATIVVTNGVHQVTGGVTIVTINQPAGQSAVGPLCLYAKDGFMINTGGNISPSLMIAAGHSAVLFYHPVLALWTGITA